jgi:hypothetical protein
MAGTTRTDFVTTFQAQQPRPLPDSFVQRLYDDYDRSERCAILRYYRSASQTFNTIGQEEADALRPLDRPALVIWGEKDPFIPVDQAEKQREAFPHARVVVIPGAGHWVHIDSADRVRGLVMPFLRPALAAGPVKPVRAGARRVRVPVRVTGIVPAYSVSARLAGASSAPATVSGPRTLALRLRRPLHAGLHSIVVSAYGLPARVVHLRVRASARRPRARPHRPPSALAG